MAQNTVCRGECSMYIWKEYVHCSLECSIHVNWVKLVDSAQVFYILTDFLSTCSLNFWARSVEIFDYNCRFVYFSVQLYQFLLHIFWSLLTHAKTFGIVSSWWIILFIIAKWSSLSLLTFFTLKSTLSHINKATSAFTFLWISLNAKNSLEYRTIVSIKCLTQIIIAIH